MKPALQSLSPQRPHRRRKGVALVLVLGFLVLISALIVAFFGSVSTDLTAANSYAAGVTTKQLTDTATNLVIGQITDATQGYKDPTSHSNLLSWASQPGMIRTYDQNGLPYRYYKLYSAENMVMTNPPAPTATPSQNAGGDPMSQEFYTKDLPGTWAGQPGLFTDLNAPVLVPDPTGAITSNGFNYRADYPIVDYSAKYQTTPTGWPPTSTGMVEGFDINTKLFPSLQSSAPGKPTSAPDANPVPMPCRWLYVLKDGTVLAPTGETNGKVTFGSGAQQPSLINPIVGRIAFWTDDETCKVNLNTAGEGTFWDQPRGQPAGYENTLGINIPGQNEYQRFAGHPAMTCLSTVFENLNSYWANPTTNPTNTTALQSYLSFAPRLAYGGSMGGTAIPSITQIIAPDHDRLFASTDEMAYDTHYSGAGTPTRALDPNLNRASVEKLKFFVTTASRAPETNLFNKPRICLWPVEMSTSLRNAKDQLLAFCTSTGISNGTGNTLYPYYFQRFNAYYPNTGTDGRTSYASPVPSSQSTWSDYSLSGTSVLPVSSGLRNATLYSYLQTLTSQAIPGFGGNFKAKYDTAALSSAGYSERDQILTEMYDTIRGGVNSYNTALAPQYDYAPTRHGGPVPGETQVVPAIIGPNGSGWDNSRLITMDNLPPTKYLPGVTKGFGRFNSIMEVGIIFYCNQYTTDSSKAISSSNQAVVQAAVVMVPFNPSPGLASWSPHVRTAITGLGNFTVTDLAGAGAPQSLYLPDYTNGKLPWNFTTARVGYVDGNHNMSIEGLMTQFHYFVGDSSDPGKKIGNDGLETSYPFVSQAPANSKYQGALVSGPSMKFSGGRIKIQIFAGYENITNNSQTPSQLVQTLMVNFPPINSLPTPTYIADGGPAVAAGTGGFNTRMSSKDPLALVEGAYAPGTHPPDADLVSGDVVRSMVVTCDSPTGTSPVPNAAMGDLRILAALDVVPEQMFSPHPSYFDASRRAAHSLRTGTPGYLLGARLVQNPPTLVKGQLWSPDPAVPAGQTTARSAYGLVGDFDNNMGGNEDGPYINKPDEGNTATGSTTYFGRGGFAVENGASYSPNRQVSSPVIFGSLPSGVKSTELALSSGNLALGKPWQTLLFCPNPSGGTNHPGFGLSTFGASNHIPPYTTPPDHLFLDLFTMPIVEPYAISDPLSTAGKINLNYQIAPFTYITRSTGIRAVMKSTKVLAIKASDNNKNSPTRYNIEMEPTNNGTLLGFQHIFDRGDIFRSASQICDIYLVPQGTGAPYDTMASFWSATYYHTGDNSREYPYGHIYPRVTTKSNTFTVHMRVQSLRKVNSPDPTIAQKNAAIWDETKDQVVGEYRGSNTIERYIDLTYTGDSSIDLPDFASNTTAVLDPYYKFRTISSKRFAP